MSSFVIANIASVTRRVFTSSSSWSILIRAVGVTCQDTPKRSVSQPHWRVVVDDRARKDLRRIDPPIRRRILNAIERLAQGAELTGDVKRLRGSNEYRLRVGDWRVRFEREDRQLVITVVRVLPRGRAYDR